MRDAIVIPAKSLADFKRAYGKDWVTAYISMWIIELNDSSSVKQKMSDVQIEFTATRIYELYSLKVTDLTLFFRNVKEGLYGSFYENLSQEKLMQWIAIYFEERCQMGQIISQSNHEDKSILRNGISKEVLIAMKEAIPKEKVQHNHEKNTLGKRLKERVLRNENERYHELFKKIKSMTTTEIKKLIVQSDSTSEFFDERFFEMLEREMDERLKIK